LDITLHCLRHSIANHLAENNAGIDFIKRFLGHADINTAYIYAIKNKKRKPVVTF
jgi:site-specific recombinase XerD